MRTFILALVLTLGGCGGDDDGGGTASCTDATGTYSHGESWMVDCNTCTCNDGTTVCTRLACIDASTGDDAGRDASTGTDGSPGDDGGGTDGGGTDGGGTDGGRTDGGSTDAGPRPDGAVPCGTDADCASGTQWCEGGVCVPCDNSGLVCLIICPPGWSTYRRNGCSPCECAPMNECTSDATCSAGTCYAGAFCWDWCPPGDPSCCFGNVCSGAGCTPPPPAGCMTRGCPRGQSCTTPSGSCEPSACFCTGSGWACTDDCGGGVCTTP